RLRDHAAHRRADGRRDDHRSAAFHAGDSGGLRTDAPPRGGSHGTPRVTRFPTCASHARSIEMRTVLTTLAIVASVTLADTAVADMGMGPGNNMGMDMAGKEKATGATHSGAGVVRKVDPSSGKVTVEHGAIASIGWPAMTMAFDVKDKSLLKDVK